MHIKGLHCWDLNYAHAGSLQPKLAEQLCHGEKTIGDFVRTRTGVKPLFVSPGHLCTLKDAIFLTLLLTDRYRLPESTRLAHRLDTVTNKTNKKDPAGEDRGGL